MAKDYRVARNLPPTAGKRPTTRTMSVIAQDPSVRWRDGGILMARAEVPAEELMPGPMGYRVHVVDFDSTTGEYRRAYQLPRGHAEEPPAWHRGSPEILDDYRFHAQNVYALVMQTLARFEAFLGRRIGWSFTTHQLKVAPHGMLDANAFYSLREEALVFGYFTGRRGQKVYSCLSHDIVVHETAHALLDALRQRFVDPSGPDQAAFHEAFADIVALLSIFAQYEVLHSLLRQGANRSGRGDLIPCRELMPDALRSGALMVLGRQMGRELQISRGDGLRRSAALPRRADWLQMPEFREPHRRGEILVAAVMNAFIEAWSRRLQWEQPRSGGGHHKAQFVADVGAEIAGTLLGMWIRALDYMPPVHLDFHDALSAVLTADYEVRKHDGRFRLRDHLVSCFRAYGIRPASRRSDIPGIWDPAPSGLQYDRVHFQSLQTDKDEVFRFIWENRAALGIASGAYTKVVSVRPCWRVGEDGFFLHETVAEYYQVARLTLDECRERLIELPREYQEQVRRDVAACGERRKAAVRGSGVSFTPGDLGVENRGIRVYGGGVLLFDEFGKLKYHVQNSIFGSRQAGRLRYLWEQGQLGADARDRENVPHFSTLHRERGSTASGPREEVW